MQECEILVSNACPSLSVLNSQKPRSPLTLQLLSSSATHYRVHTHSCSRSIRECQVFQSNPCHIFSCFSCRHVSAHIHSCLCSMSHEAVPRSYCWPCLAHVH